MVHRGGDLMSYKLVIREQIEHASLTRIDVIEFAGDVVNVFIDTDRDNACSFNEYAKSRSELQYTREHNDVGDWSVVIIHTWSDSS
jgi:hypothetical protein